MTIDKSLKINRTGVTNKSVMTRVERIERLRGLGKLQDGGSPYGLPKVRVIKISLKKKKKTKKDEEK